MWVSGTDSGSRRWRILPRPAWSRGPRLDLCHIHHEGTKDAKPPPATTLLVHAFLSPSYPSCPSCLRGEYGSDASPSSDSSLTGELVGIQVLPPPPDQLHLRLQPRLEPRLDLDLRPLDQGPHVGRGGVARVDEVVRVHGRHLRPPGPHAFEAGRLDELAGGAGTAFPLPARARRVFEHAAAARLVERGPALAPLEHLGDLLVEVLLGPGSETDRRAE